MRSGSQTSPSPTSEAAALLGRRIDLQHNLARRSRAEVAQDEVDEVRVGAVRSSDPCHCSSMCGDRLTPASPLVESFDPSPGIPDPATDDLADDVGG